MKGVNLKEDEREVLAHIVQNIDEQEIFLEFVAKAETIKEAWQIAKIFESKKKEFIDNIQEYDALIKDKEKQLKSITAEITEANELLKDANKELETIRTQLEEMQSKAQFYKNKIMQGKQTEYLEFSDSMENNIFLKDDTESNLLDFENIIAEFKPLSTVSVHVKNGATAIARVAQIIYPPELYEVYQRAGKRLFRLKDKINELELTNKKLSVELRDLSEEDNFKENMRNTMGIDNNEDYRQIIPNIKTQPNIKSQKDKTFDMPSFDINSFEQAERMARIDKKKEKVEEMLSQLTNVLRDEGINTTNNQDGLLKDPNINLRKPR